MSVKIMIHYPHLKELVNNQDVVEVRGATIGQCLNDLANRFPGIRTRIFNEQGKLLHFVVILHNGENIQGEQDPLERPVSDGDEIAIALLIAGGNRTRPDAVTRPPDSLPFREYTQKIQRLAGRGL